MLVLTRRNGEEIVIDGHIRVTIVSVRGHRVRVGITAPPEVRVDRDEVHQQVSEFHERVIGSR
jgi:carbon storage regulator